MPPTSTRVAAGRAGHAGLGHIGGQRKAQAEAHAPGRWPENIEIETYPPSRLPGRRLARISCSVLVQQTRPRGLVRSCAAAHS